MLMKDDRKKQVSIIMKRMKGSDGMDHEEMESSPTNEYGDEMESSAMDHALEAMMNAMQSRDKSELKSSLKSIMMMMMNESSEHE